MSQLCHRIEEDFAERGPEALAEESARGHIDDCQDCTAVFAALGQIDTMLTQLAVVDAPGVEIRIPTSESAWHVEIESEQQGPLGIAAIEEHWDARQIDAETYVKFLLHALDRRFDHVMDGSTTPREPGR